MSVMVMVSVVIGVQVRQIIFHVMQYRVHFTSYSSSYSYCTVIMFRSNSNS